MVSIKISKWRVKEGQELLSVIKQKLDLRLFDVADPFSEKTIKLPEFREYAVREVNAGKTASDDISIRLLDVIDRIFMELLNTQELLTGGFIKLVDQIQEYQISFPEFQDAIQKYEKDKKGMLIDIEKYQKNLYKVMKMTKYSKELMDKISNELRVFNEELDLKFKHLKERVDFAEKALKEEYELKDEKKEEKQKEKPPEVERMEEE